MNKTYITIALLSPLACTAAMGARKAKASNQQKPNVIIILADDLGYGDLGCYGAKNVETPNVDKLAKQGIRFTDAHAIASTSTPIPLFSSHGRICVAQAGHRCGSGRCGNDYQAYPVYHG